MSTKINYKEHWDKIYSKSEIEKLGWYEESPKPSLALIEKCKLNKDALSEDELNILNQIRDVNILHPAIQKQFLFTFCNIFCKQFIN